MIFKNLLRILKNYRFFLIKIIFYELLYLLKGYKGNKFTFSTNDIMTDNIPCPYYFLQKIEKIIRKKNFDTFLDLGCGSGRAINFFNKKLANKNLIGIEYFEEQFLICKKNFQKKNNIKLFREDFLKFDFLKLNADCYFINDPIKDDKVFISIIEKIVHSDQMEKGCLLIFVNCNNNVLNTLSKAQCIETFYINDKKGFSIYYVKNK